jgi:hypothetical protein
LRPTDNNLTGNAPQMKDLTDNTGMDENVVLFAPRQTLKAHIDEDLDDPLEALLQEFEDISSSFDDEKYLDDDEEELEAQQVVYKSALPEELLAHEFSKAHEFQKRIELMQEVNKRIKHYLDEVELFIPKLNNN